MWKHAAGWNSSCLDDAAVFHRGCANVWLDQAAGLWRDALVANRGRQLDVGIQGRLDP